MADPKVIKVWKGANLYETVTVTDEANDARDLTGATLSVQGSDALFELDLQAAHGADTGEVVISAAEGNTIFAKTGLYEAQVWADWASGNPTKEMLKPLWIAVMETPGA